MAAAVVTAGIPLTGAFTSVSAERSVSVAVADDDEAFLSLEPSDGSNGVYAAQTDGTLELRFDGTGTLASGLNPDATTYVDGVFVVTNRGTNDVTLTIDDPAEGLAFYATYNGTQHRLDGPDAEGVPVGVGETANVSIELDTSNESAIEAVDEITIAANASADVGEGGSDDGDTDPGGGADEDTPQTRVSGDELRLTGSATAGQSLTLDLSQLSDTDQDDIRVDSLEINYTNETIIETTVDAVDGSNTNSSTDRTAPGNRTAPTNASVLTYLNVSHPETADDSIGDATFQFVLPHGPQRTPTAVDLLRYNEQNDTWETTSTRISFVANTSDGYVYEARTESLSLFAVVEVIRGEVIEIDGTAQPVDAALITDPSASFPTTAYDTYHDEAFNASYWNAEATSDADDAAAVIRERLRIDLKQAAKDSVISKIVSYADGVLKTAIGFSGIGTLLTVLDITLSSSEFVGSLGPAIQKQAVAIHVDPGEQSHDELRANLRALEENSAALKNATAEGDTAERRALLRERETLLRETYQLLPRYTNDVHEDVVGNAAGMEDPQSYKLIRSNTESLRVLLKEDYRETTKQLYGAPKRSLAYDTSMPTHGWVAFGNAEVYDTMDHGNDYVVVAVDASQAVEADADVSISVTGADASELDTALVSDRPDDPRTVTGRSLGPDGTAVVDDPEETMYLVVRPGGTSGPVRIQADAGSTPIRMSVAERAGPDIQRPHADLVSGPDPVTLRDGDVVYPTNDSDTDLVWRLWDDKTETTAIDYRLRVDDGDGFDTWTAWQGAPADGRVSPDLTYDDGLTRVQLQVRDGAGRTTVRNADVVMTAGVPQTALAAPDAANPESGEVFVRVLPERRMERIDVQYRPVGNDTWRDLRTVTDTAGFESVMAPPEGKVVIRARAANLAGETGEWATEKLTYDPTDPPDTTPPEVDLEQAPDRRLTLVDGERVERRVVSAETATVRWSATDDETLVSDLEYRVRVDNESWSEWRTSSGEWFGADPTVSTDGTTVHIEVRDAAGNVARRSVSILRDTSDPTVDVTATSDITGAVVNPSADEPLESVQLQYRPAGETEWREWDTIGSTDTTAVDLDSIGSFELRARGVDTAGNVGPWTEPVAFDSLPAERSDSISDGSRSVAGGNTTEYDYPNASKVGADAARGYLMYNALVDEIDGELLLDVYMVSRDGNEVPISSIELTEERNQTVVADLPGNLTDADRLRVEVSGNGTVVLSSLRAIGSEPTVPPVSASPMNATVGQTVIVSTDGEVDEEYIQAYEWDLNGDDEFERTTDAPTTDVAYDDSGTRTITLRVTDVFGASASETATVRVNAPPRAEVTGERTVLTGELATLNAGDSVDPDGEVESVAWDTDGDGTTEATGWTTPVSYADDGEYPVSVTVTDDDGDQDTTTTNVTVRNRPPTANAAANQTTPLVGESVAFDATGSSDPDGQVTTSEWDVDGDGTFERTGETIATSFTEPGNRTVTVRVTDDDGVTDETTVTVHVNAPPEAALNATSPVYTDEEVDLDATESADPDGTIVGYGWTVDGPTPAPDGGASGTVTFSDDGEYPVSVIVTDDDGASDTVMANVTVLNRPPNVKGTVTTDVPVVGESVAFDASESSDPDGTVVASEWDVDGDGTAEKNGSTVSAAYEAYGTKTATVAVTDDDGATNETTVSFYVNAPPEPAIDADTPVYTDEPITLDAGDSIDPDGDVVAYLWDTDADGAVDANGQTTSVSYPDDGTYEVTLTVEDNNGTTRTATGNVTVLNRPPQAVAAANESDPTVRSVMRFDAADSVDPDGEVEAYEWDLDGDGSFERMGEAVTTSFAESGNQTVTVRVTDDDGATNRTNVTVDVNAPPEPAVDLPSSVLTGEELTLNASESADPDGEIVAYEWDLGGTAVQTGETVSREYADDGTYAVTLTVTDDDGASASLTRNVTVENRPPELWLTRVSPDTTPVETYETVEYTVDALDDDGTAGNTSITFTSPTNRTRTVLADGTTTVRFNESGNWTVVATVFDDDGATTTVNRTLPVNAPPDAGIDARTEVVAGESVTLSADAVDTDGTVREYTWLVGNDSYTGQNVTVTLSEAGDVRVDLFVEDDDGAVTEVNRTIEVEPAYDLSLEVEPLFGGRVLSASSYPDYRYDDENVSFEWDLDGDGRFETAGGYVHDRIVNESGTYEVAVRVSGPEIPTTTETETVSVDSVDTNVTIDWRRDVGIGETVTVTNDRVIVSGGEEQAPEGEDEGGSTIRALSRSNGSTIWEATLPFGAYETIVRDGAVYAVGEGVARVDVDTGAVDWTWSGDGYVDATVAGESVYVTDDRRAVALAIDDGLERWNRTADAPVYEQVVGADVIATYGQTYNETSNRLVSSLVVRDRDTGTILWSLTREGAPSLAGVVDGRVLVSTDGNLTARDAGDGEELWTRRLPDAAEYSYISDVRIEGDTIYAMAEQYPNRSVTALRSNGTRVWSTRVRDDAEFRVGPEHVVVAAEGGVTAYDRTDGSVVWNRSLSIDYPNVVRIVDGRVLVESDGIGTVLDAETGETRWRGATDYALYGAGYRDGTLYVGTGAGVYAVSVEDDR